MNTITIDISQVSVQLADLLSMIANGETVLLIEDGKPVAQLIPAEESIEPRILGLHEGKIWIESATDGRGTRVVFTLPIGDDEKSVLSVA